MLSGYLTLTAMDARGSRCRAALVLPDPHFRLTGCLSSELSVAREHSVEARSLAAGATSGVPDCSDPITVLSVLVGDALCHLLRDEELGTECRLWKYPAGWLRVESTRTKTCMSQRCSTPPASSLGHDLFSTTRAGYRALVRWMRSFGDVRQVGIEGTGSYGAGVTRHLHDAGIEVFEIDRPDRSDRRLRGKSDTLDAENAARAVLAGRR